MSKIVEKVFNASKKIVRSIFMGSPNLLTSSDLNRQFEAMKHQMDKLDEKTGLLIDEADLMYELSSGSLKVWFDYGSIDFKGCSFIPDRPDPALTINMTASAPFVYLCLVADKKVVTYSDDATHEIAGAKFEDDSSMPAANQIVYENEKFILTHSLSVDNIVGVVAYFYYDETLDGHIKVTENWVSPFESLRDKDTALEIALTRKFASRTYFGVWGYFHQGLSEITEDQLNALTSVSPCTFIKEGSFYHIRLRGLAQGEATSSNVSYNLQRFLMSDILDVGGYIFIKDMPAFSISRYMGASIGISPTLRLTSAEADEKVSSVAVYAEYMGEIATLKGWRCFKLSSRSDYSEKLGSGGTPAGDGGVFVTLHFMDREIEG